MDVPNATKNTMITIYAIIPNATRITLTIPSHIPAVAKPLPASDDSPLFILCNSELPITHATIPQIKGQTKYETIPNTNARIELVLAFGSVFGGRYPC